jgi:hypothetical protein
MRGHEHILALRKAGAVPRSVWFAFDGDGWRWWPWSTGRAGGVAAEVLIEPDDSPARLDLRFVVGLLCHVQGRDERRVHRLHSALSDAGAARVLSTVMVNDECGVERAASIVDTAGALGEPA